MSTATRRRARFGVLDETFGSGATLLLGALIAAGAASLALRLVVSASERHGLDNVFLVLALAAMPLDAVLLLVARNAAGRERGGAALDWRGLAHKVTLGAAALAIAGAFTANVLHLGGRAPLTTIAVACSVLAMGAAVVPRAVLLGRGQFEAVAFAAIASALARLFVALVLVASTGRHLLVAALAILVGESVACAVVRFAATIAASPSRSEPLTIGTGELVSAFTALG
ncbi:MAG TPA: hypothetical protein VFW74_13560, partial [Acidimicrobiia bacterium]|nr:hypothetical protein [Acidimicrobiia bacterium]